jgi:hypothetical protein
VETVDNPAVRGMVEKVRHLVVMEEVAEKPKPAKKAKSSEAAPRTRARKPKTEGE